ncbi:hypothetical protein OA86_00035 [Kaistella jeonii]|uniref:Uncharacterized protein n=2 Tax=Kaistella jeonii TaxID=266749 RepID=A0A0C1D0W0_9FLAO|nr:hypothetical protein OA86_00035 [Kaistella jeonii]
MFSLSSCHSTKQLIRKNNFKIAVFDKEKLNGTYSNGLKDSLPKNLWTTLKSSYSDIPTTTNKENYNVKLTLLDNENINIKLWNETDEYVIEEFNLKGKIKDNFFSINRKQALYPFFPIFYFNDETKTIIGNDWNGNLILVSGKINEAMILFISGGNRSVNNEQFKRIKN